MLLPPWKKIHQARMMRLTGLAENRPPIDPFHKTFAGALDKPPCHGLSNRSPVGG